MQNKNEKCGALMENLGYKAIFDETVDAVFITDGISEKILDVNKAACQLVECDREELIGNHLYNFFDEVELSELNLTPSKIKMYDSVLSNKKLKTKSGKRIPVDLTINTFADEEKNFVMTSFRDVSERIKYENEIVQMNEELTKLNISKDKLFSIIAHDLKNPIGALISLSELMTSGEEDISAEEMLEFSGMIKNLSKNTFELLENLLSWSRVQTKKIEIEKKKFDLSKLADKIISLLKPSAELKKINLINSVPANFKIYADENMSNTIIRNLISNAIKFSPENSNIDLRAYEEDNTWNIAVVDEGIGMEESFIADLFKIDVHTSRSGTNKEKGTGLGLVLCNEFAKLHNGTIEVISELNKGSQFIVKFPVEKEL